MTYTREQFAFIVKQLATYVGPTQIAIDFERQWKGTRCVIPNIKDLTPDWRAYFDEERESFLDAPIAESRFRLAELYRMYVAARDRTAWPTAVDVLVLAAKEAEGFYGGKSKVPPPGSGGVGVESIVVEIVDSGPPNAS